MTHFLLSHVATLIAFIIFPYYKHIPQIKVTLPILNPRIQIALQIARASCHKFSLVSELNLAEDDDIKDSYRLIVNSEYIV